MKQKQVNAISCSHALRKLHSRAEKGWAMKRARPSKRCDAVDWDQIRCYLLFVLLSLNMLNSGDLSSFLTFGPDLLR